MVKNSKVLEKFERDYVSSRKQSYAAKLKIYEALYKEARQLGTLPLKNPLESIETVIKLAKALNSV
ncbi:hypothetical protein KJ633_07790 [bacterium]|nr:hypothetical protein [bacterium]MBU3956347.1 hypothetical protein [bacterium]